MCVEILSTSSAFKYLLILTPSTQSLLFFSRWNNYNFKNSRMAMGQKLETLKSKFDRILDWWKDKTPIQKWNSIMQIGIAPGHLIGVHLFCDLLINWYSASCGLMIAMFFTLNFYTIQFYLRRSEIVRGMECTYLVGVVVGVCKGTSTNK